MLRFTTKQQTANEDYILLHRKGGNVLALQLQLRY